MTTVILIRHGQTDHNVEHRWQGWSDTPLNATGLEQASRVAVRLARKYKDIRAIYSSPLTRAYQTARIIGRQMGLPVTLMEGLREMHFGLLEGLTTEEFRARYPEEYERFQNRRDPRYTYPNGENREGFHRRVHDSLECVLERHPHETVVVVCHGGTLRAALAFFFPDQPSLWERFAAMNCSITQVTANGAGAELVVLDDREHLETMQA